MRIKIVTLSSKAPFTIPKARRTRLGIQPGDQVEFWVEKGSMRAWTLNPVTKCPRLA